MSTQAVGRSGGRGWAPDLSAGLIAACSVLLAAAVVVGRGVGPVAAMLVLVSVLVAWHRWIFAWDVLLCLLIATVLFIPVGRYTLAIDLPFGLELYRVVVSLVVLVWVASLLVDPRVRVRRTPLDGPVALLVVASLGSILVNFGRVAPLGSPVFKAVSLFLTFVILYYFVSSVVRTAATVVLVTQFIVAGVAVVAFFAIVEQRTGYNVFDQLRIVFPFLEFQGSAPVLRYGLLRAFGSADHPIALGVLLGMTVPLGVAVAKLRSRVWWFPTSLIVIGVLVTASRTPILVMLAAAAAFLWLRPRDLLPLLPWAVPMLIVIKLVAPGSIATVKNAFFPEGRGLIAEQSTLAADPTLISGRANLGARISEGLRTPVLGQGLGTRQTGEGNPYRNAPILDNQWLGVFLDVGVVGVVAWLWLIVRIVRRLGGVARTRGSPESVLAAGFVASIIGFAVGMLVYDSFAFVQATFVFWALLALAATLVAVQPVDRNASPRPAGA